MELNRIPNSRNDPRLSYEETRRETQSGDSDRVRGARQALVRLSELRAAQLRRGRGNSNEAHIEKTRDAHKGADQIEISNRARIMASEHEHLASSDTDSARESKVAELKARMEQGGINTPEALERAAAGLLGSRNG
ncbi:MAG: anti-sigma28 factor (negative regulator of flagellin synthesis) [Planctomycetota bacterium]|jgi:anti-sigma28 factor (negative regulator of flagellin synthesis)